MNKFALIGYPLGHSMSPLIHEKLFALSGKEAEYSLIEIAPEDLAQKRELLETLGGLNVTIPHKQAVIPLVDELGESAERYNSVNCIHNDGGKLVGYNTDCDGFVLSAEQLKSSKSGSEYTSLSGKVLLVGCGGVGRMIAIEAVRHGADLTIAIIPQDRKLADTLIEEINEKFENASVKVVLISEIEGEFDLLVNATPVGMHPKTEAVAVSDEVIANCDNVFDVIYNPTETLLMKKARAMGKTAAGGAAMLVYQAVKAHEIWYGGKFSTEDVASIITEVEKAVDNMNKEK